MPFGGCVRGSPTKITNASLTIIVIVSRESGRLFYFLFFHSKKSGQIEGGGKYGGFGHLWPSGDRRSDFTSGFLLYTYGYGYAGGARLLKTAGTEYRNAPGGSADHINKKKEKFSKSELYCFFEGHYGFLFL